MPRRRGLAVQPGEPDDLQCRMPSARRSVRTHRDLPMSLLQLALTHVRCIEEAALEVPPGLTRVCGSNGSHPGPQCRCLAAAVWRCNQASRMTCSAACPQRARLCGLIEICR